MTTVRTLTSAEVARAIRAAFEDAGPCDCHTVVKLGEGELMDYLLSHGVIQPEHASGVALLEITALEAYSRYELWPRQSSRPLYLAGIKSLNELRGWTFADLLKLPGMTVKAAKEVEGVLAEFGILLEGGDPALLEQHRIEPEPPIDGPLPDGTPEEIRHRATEALFEIASKLVDDGLSLMKLVAKTAAKTAKKGALKRYVAFRQTAWEDVERVAAPLFAIEALEKEQARGKPSKAKAEPALRLVGAA